MIVERIMEWFMELLIEKLVEMKNIETSPYV